MGLNIKDSEVEANIRELAQLTGRSLTQAVDSAVLAELERIRRERVREGMAERLMEIGRRAAAKADPPFVKGEDPTAYLYDPDTGLPR